jgi:drug/metabolite transporter (DMT)-like permease
VVSRGSRMPAALALISGLFHALWNALAKRTKKERGAVLAILTISWLTSSLGLALVPHVALPPDAVPWALLAGFGEAAYVVSLGIAYARGDLALTYALSRGLALVAIWPLSALAFGTAPSGIAIAATALVVLSTWLCRPSAATATTTGGRVSIPWTIATGLSVGVYHTGYKGAVLHGAEPVTSFSLALTVAVPLLWLTLGREARTEARSLARDPRSYLAGVLSAASFVLMIFALQSAESGRILGIRNGSVAFAVVLAFALGERPSRRQWAGIAVMSAGIVLFALAP